MRLTNEQLRADWLPSSEDHLAVLRFAGTFDGYAEMGGFHESASLANAALARYVSAGQLPESLTDLRNCLFFEHRRWRHYGEDPNAEAQAYVDALMAAIRLRVVGGELD